MQNTSRTGSDSLPPLERVAGTEFLASVEMLDLFSLGIRWAEGAMQSQRQWFEGLQKDMTITAEQLGTTGPVAALADHVNRRTQGLAGVMAKHVENNMALLEGVLRAHEGFMRAVVISKGNERTSGIPEKAG